MQPFTTLTAIAAPIDEINLDTNQLAPTRFNKVPYGSPDYQRILLHDRRFHADGSQIAEFVLNREPYRRAGIIVGERGFGCGSSRESAAASLLAFGIRCVIAPSFGDIFSKNCTKVGVLLARVSGAEAARLRELVTRTPGLQITVDLAVQSITAEGAETISFKVPALAKMCLLEGLDDLEMVRALMPEIEAFERRHLAAAPWLAPAPPGPR